MDESRDLYGRALSVLPGGVNSSVRAVHPHPFFVERGDGGHLVTADGERYLDFVMGYGPLLLGHDAPESVQAAVQSAASAGPMYGAPTEVEVELAEFVARHVPSVEMLRFVNSGTEATVSAVRLARGVTGRDKVVVMQGGYHGAQESTLVAGDADDPRPSTPGVPQAFAEHTLPVPFNDVEAVTEVFEEHGEDIACVLTEPVLGNHGIVHPVAGYHETLRDLCDDHDALLVFDEVITGFRLGGLSCAQGALGVEPDLTTFGKVVGGGYPVGAVGGPAGLVEEFTPSGDVFQSGTFSGHPVTMAAGLATLEYAAGNDVYAHVDRLGARLRDGLRDVLAEHAPNYTVVGSGSTFKVVFTRDGDARADPLDGLVLDPDADGFDAVPKNGGDVEDADTERWERLFWPAMLDEGVFLTPNQFESQFVSAAHTEADVDAALDAYETVLAERV